MNSENIRPMEPDRAWYRAQCVPCGLWYPIALLDQGKQLTPPCPNCGVRYVDLGTIWSIPAEVAEEWRFGGPELMNQEEMTKLLALRTKHADWLAQLNG